MLSSGLIRPKLKEMGCHIREDCRKTNEKEILAQTREELISLAGKTAGLFGSQQASQQFKKLFAIMKSNCNYINREDNVIIHPVCAKARSNKG